jgi:cytoskeletal protein RodZ
MDDFGSRLKRAREAQNLSLKEIEGRTKISVSVLEALERGDVSKLPGGIFGRAFVRTYALELGLDPEAIVSAFLVQLGISEREAAERALARPEITADDRAFLERQHRAIRGLRIVAIIVAIGAIALVLWQLRRFVLPPSPSPSAVPAAEMGPPASTGAPEARGPARAPVAPVPLAAGDADPDPSPPAATPLVVELTATEDSWVYAGADGKRVMSQLMRPGDTRALSATREVLLDVGNAGGIRWTVNGRPAKALGRPGAHVRVTVTPDNVADFLPLN